MKRIRHFFNTIQTNWSDDPAARGAAKMTAGAILVAEGVFGVARRAVSRGRRRGKNSAGGLMGGIIGVIVGIVFMVVGSAMGPDDFADQATAQGQIVDMESSRNNEGQTMYTPIYAFEVDGQEYRFSPSMRSSSRPNIGQQVEIAYSASDPRNARRTDGMESKIHWFFIGGGLLVLLTSLFSLAISVALIVLGIMLFRSGRADRKAAGETGSFFSDLMSIARKASSGEIDVDQTAVGQPGSSQGNLQSA
jgi:uncharacterized membrane protein HdeD (DUF308 family)